MSNNIFLSPTMKKRYYGYSNIVAIDIGTKNSAIAKWTDGKLVGFDMFGASNIVEFVTSMTRLKDFITGSTHVFVEKQMLINYKALQIESYITCWFAVIMPEVVVVSFPARGKYRFIDKGVYNTKLKRKKWAVEYIKTILDTEMLQKLCKMTKKDDVADAILIGLVVLESDKTS